MSIWSKTGRLAASALLVGVGMLLGVALVQTGPAIGTEAPIERTATESAATATSDALPTALPQVNFVDVSARVQPAVVFIRAVRSDTRPAMSERFNDFFDFFRRENPDVQPEDEPEEYQQQSQGSGVIVSGDGYILTNSHVVATLDRQAGETIEAEDVTVTLITEEEYRAEIVGVDLGTDIAVLKIDPRGPLPHLEFGDSEAVRVGEWVLAVGAPFGLRTSVSAGIISAKGRAGIGIEARYQDFLQTDAAINPGNSGGPLIDLRGNIIGINTAIATNGFMAANQGVGFAVPVNMARHVMEQIVERGRVIRGWLGVRVQEFATSEAREAVGLPTASGAVGITEISPEGGPADLAGLEAQDIVIAMDGEPLRGMQDFLQRIAFTAPGDTVALTVLRGDAEIEIDVTVGERPPEEDILLSELGAPQRPQPDEPDRDRDFDLGVTVTELTDEIAEQLGVDADTEGVVITQVRRNSTASRMGLARGDLVLSINRQRIGGMDDFVATMESLEPGDAVLFYVRRMGGARLFLPGRLPRE